MDNITHSLAGMLVAEAVCTFRREVRPELRAAAYLLSALANNLPDIDIVYSSWITGPKPLGSLLHHRGHTHTLLVGLLVAWLLYWLALRWFARKNQLFGEAERRLLLALCLAGPLLHLSMDLGNNYGVHPFWPVSGRWFYGDTIFIVEPLWWAFLVPVFARTLSRRWLKVLLWGALGVVIVVAWFVPFVHRASLWTLLGLTTLSFFVAELGSPRLRVLWAIAGCLVVGVLFFGGSRWAKAKVARAMQSALPALEVHDIVTTPMPANPTCWEALVAGEQGGSYRVVRASVALPPLSVEGCAAGSGVVPTAATKWLDRPDRDGVRFQTEYRAELSELRDLQRRDCRFRALLKFARLPYATESLKAARDRPTGFFAGDLRYDREPGRDFSDINLSEAGKDACPRFVPGWAEPRADLLQP